MTNLSSKKTSRTVYFYNKPLYCFRGVYLPHYETDMIFQLLDPIYDESWKIVEIGVGTAAISIGLAVRYARKNVIYGYESDDSAYNNAVSNIIRHNLNIIVIKQDIRKISISADLIISNPPYIKTDECRVRTYAPINAIDGGVDGLDIVRYILNMRSRYIILELGYIEQIEKIKSQQRYELVRYIKPIDSFQLYFVLLRYRDDRGELND